jgi:FSR family fosmidomycin resistance protein-like MFS transporter
MNNRFQFGNVSTISITHFIHDIYSSFLAPVLPLIIEKLSISLSLAGLLSVIQRIPSLLNPFIGILADKIKVRYFVIFAPAVTTISMSLIGIAPGYIILASLLFISGISSTLFHVPSPVMIKRVSGSRIGKGMSFYMLGGETARTVGPLIIVAAVEIWGLQGSLKLIPFGLIASAIMFYRLKDIDIRKDLQKEKKETGYISTFNKFLPVYLTLAGITFFRGAMRSALTLYLPVYLVDKGANLWFAGISLSLIQLTGALGAFYSGTISDIIGRRTTLLILTIISPLLMLAFINLKGIFIIPILFLTGFFLISPTPVMLAVINELDTEHPAFVNGIFMTINFFLNSLTLLLVGLLSDKFGLDLTYKIAAGIALISVFFAMRIPKRKKKLFVTK